MKRESVMMEFGAALSLTVAQIFMTLAVIFFVLSSYEWWGSPTTPLAGLWKVAILLFILQSVLRFLHRKMIQKIIDVEPAAAAEISTWSSMSQVSVPRLQDEDLISSRSSCEVKKEVEKPVSEEKENP